MRSGAEAVSDARPATDRVMRGDVIAKLRSSQARCMCHEKNVYQMTHYLDAAPPTPEEIDRLARCLWARDGLPRRVFDNAGSDDGIVCVKTSPGATKGESMDALRAIYRRDAAKMLVILQQGGNFDAE